MTKAWKMGLRLAGLLGLAIAIAHCGDSDVRVTTGGVNPQPGVFNGTTGLGETFTIIVEVGGIGAIEFECDGETISETFDPPVNISNDGVYDLGFDDAGRKFEIDGQFTDQNNTNGDINDKDDACDSQFDAVRNGVVLPTPTRTPTSGVTSTPGGPTATSTPVPSGEPTETSSGPTPTGGGTVPTATPTAAANLCPAQVTLEGQGEQADLDTGWTGIAMDQVVVGKGTLTVALDCGGRAVGACGSCTVSGPIASTTSVDNQRCAGDTSITCTDSSQCGGSGPCTFLFGAPLPLSSGGVPVCVTNKVNGGVTGTANPDTGAGSSSVNLTSSVFTGIDVAQPCPRCTGASFGASGTCIGGARNGQTCTVDGTSNLFGNTSFDCPPNAGANVGNLAIALNPTTFTSTLNTGGNCAQFPFTSFPCFCTGQTSPNACTDATCTADATGEGECLAGPFDQNCSIDTFRGCLSNADCPRPGDTCETKTRKCQGNATAGDIDGTINRTGQPNKTSPTVVSTFCVAATSSSAVNTAGGLPGPGALRLPSKACYDTTCTF